MKQALDIRFIGLALSEAVATAARDKAAKLDQYFPDIMSCRVTVEQAHKHQNQGRAFAVRIDVTVPGRELVVNRAQDEDVYIALRDAFEAMRRQLDPKPERRRSAE